MSNTEFLHISCSIRTTPFVTAQSQTNDRGGNVSYSSKQNLNRRPPKKIKNLKPAQTALFETKVIATKILNS